METLRNQLLLGVGVISAVLAGCRQPPEPQDGREPGAECPLSKTAQGLLRNQAENLLNNATWVTQRIGERERGYAYSLLGVGEGYQGALTVIAQCTEAIHYATYCNESSQPPGEPTAPFWKTRDRCVRLGCEAAGIALVDVYFTMRPHTAPDDRHKFSYETTDPSGIAVSDPNPLITWRLDIRNPTVAMTADFSSSLIVRPKDSEALDFSGMGKVDATRMDGKVTAAGLALSFPKLGAKGAPIDLNVKVNDAGDASGGVTSNGEVLAVAGGHNSLSLNWQGRCSR